MARYEHLPIFRDAYDLAVHTEKIVRNFSRYHKYTIGTDLRNKTREILERIVKANSSPNRAADLLELRQELEALKVTARLCHDSGGFSGTRSYLYVAERIINIAGREGSPAGAGQGQDRAVARQCPGGLGRRDRQAIGSHCRSVIGVPLGMRQGGGDVETQGVQNEEQ